MQGTLKVTPCQECNTSDMWGNLSGPSEPDPPRSVPLALSPQTTAHFGLGSIPEGCTKPAPLNLHEGMSDAVSWRSQENSEWSQSATTVHKVWISLVGGKMDFAWNLMLFIWLGSCMRQQSCSVWLKIIPQDALMSPIVHAERERERESLIK